MIKAEDIERLPTDLATVRVQYRLTTPMALRLLDRCRGLERVIFTNFAYRQTSDRVFRLLDEKGIATKCDRRTQGRPVELTREQVRLIKSLRTQGLSYREIAERVGCSYSAVANHCRGRVKGKRWREEYR